MHFGGFCPGDYGFMRKRVLVTDNDRVISTPKGLRINGEPLRASVPLETDKAGRTTPRYPFSDYALRKSELLLMLDVSGAFFP
jgi:type IV secretory pathway protease TraF